MVPTTSIPLGARRLEGMELLARQEYDVPRVDPRPEVLGPHAAGTGKDDERFLVKVAVGLGLRPRDVADELGDDLRAHRPVHEHLEVAVGHSLALGGVEGNDPLGMSGVEVSGHPIEPPGLRRPGTGGGEEPYRRAILPGDAERFSRRDVDPGVGRRGELPARDRDLGRPVGDEQHHVALAEGHHRRLPRARLEVELRLVDRAVLRSDDHAVAERPPLGLARPPGREHVAAPVEHGPAVLSGGHLRDRPVRLAPGVVLGIVGEEVVVRAVAEGGRPRVLAAAEEHLLALGAGAIANRPEVRALVPAVAVGLGPAPPATAPGVGPPRLELGVVRLVAGDPGGVAVFGFGHVGCVR